MHITGPDGKLIPYGKVYKSLVADFTDGTIPAWLETATKLAADATEVVGAGTTFEPLPGRGDITVTAPRTNNSYADIRTKVKFDPTKFTAIKFTLESLQFTGNTWQTAQIGIKTFDSTAGITLLQTNTSGAGAVIRIYRSAGAGGNVDRPIKMALHTVGLAGDEGQNRKNISLVLLTGKQYNAAQERQFVLVMNDDQVGAYEEITGLLTPGEYICTARLSPLGLPAEQPERYIRASKVKVELWTN
ncbi:hypothetical protein KQ941_02795 [Paenibacillus xylanexedens]|jgi:hypothetical protein|uniref:hypothetical protein n=1 Tax=Paenibacillus xylanexedens TaxID=528191 RepID=UPI001F1D5F58|nr:hypothetical protein [Paenibacillus xylanexedens]MCF7753356.1 hypothetical protein [Paenibacillus xylanexedens]